MTILQNDHGNKECNCDQHSVISDSTTFSHEQPIYSVPSVITTPTRVLTDNDKQSIISSSSSDSSESSGGRKKHSIFPNVKKFIQYNNFQNEKDSALDDENTTTIIFVQKWLNAIAALDLVLFAISIILAISTEKYLCYDGPVRLDYSRSVFLSNSTSSEDVEAGSIFSLTAYEFVKENLLKKMMYDSPLAYHFIVIVLLAIGMGYFVTEIWMFCLLIKIGREKRPAQYCIKWMVWRSIILTITLIIAFSDVIHAHQVTCSEVIVVPFQVVRMFIGGVPVIWVLYNRSRSMSSDRGFL